MIIDSDVVNNIYTRMGDDLSRRIFTDRLMYSLSEDSCFLEDLVSTTQPGFALLDKIKKLKEENKEIIIYGAGVSGRSLYATYKKYIDFFVDKNCDNCKATEIPILPLCDLCKHTDAYIMVSLSYSFGEENYRELLKFLIEQGIREEQILAPHYHCYHYFTEKIYFDLPFINWIKNFTFLDIGSYDGANSIQFLNYYKNKVGVGTPEVIAVEPGLKYCCELEKVASLAKQQGAEFNSINCGVCDTTGKVKFKITHSGMLVKDINGSLEVNCRTVDDILCGKKVDLIKMDIEGCEYNALKGTINTISKYKPQLAISIYHKAEDIIKLPELIMNMNLDYRFYLRHYTIEAGDTVLYAI